MWFGKLSLKAAALVLFGAVSSMAAETAVAIAIIINVYRNVHSDNVDSIQEMKN